MFKIRDLYSIFAVYGVNPFDSVDHKAEIIKQAQVDGLIDKTEFDDAVTIIEDMRITEIKYKVRY